MDKKILRLSLILLAAVLLLGAGCVAKEETTTTTTPTTTVETTALFDENTSDAKILADENGQWATTAKASTQYGDESWAAKQATGQPNVNTYTDDMNAWAPKEKNKGEETLELTYAKPVYATGVRIRESLGSGAVIKVELKDTDGQYHKIWEGIDSTRGLNYLQLGFTKTDYKVNGVKITFDTTKSPDEWVEVDAVQLVGKTT